MWEGIMLICFGVSWPPAIIKTLKVKNPKGKSFVFLSLVLIGYLSGIIGKASSQGIGCLSNWVFWLYVLDFSMVATDYFFSMYYTIQRKKQGLD
ncbi:MAG: hypothetical protein E7058_04345 [Lentisphaerae bacterium]|nr:hypothetical protein [Lentisphaerota bacterium]